MRWTILLGLLAALVLAPAARASDTAALLRDCQDDSVLEGHYTVAELRKARNEVVGDANEYTDCVDVLSRQIAAQVATSKPSSNSGSNSGAGGSSGSGSSSDGNNSAGSGTRTSSAGAAATSEPSPIVTPSTQQDGAALLDATKQGAQSVTAEGHPLAPGGRLVANVGRNGLPSTLVVVLVLLGASALAAAGPFIRRRVSAHRQA
jgi:hypothetical protein